MDLILAHAAFPVPFQAETSRECGGEPTGMMFLGEVKKGVYKF
jgi:hypothetical protein